MTVEESLESILASCTVLLGNSEVFRDEDIMKQGLEILADELSNMATIVINGGRPNATVIHLADKLGGE